MKYIILLVTFLSTAMPSMAQSASDLAAHTSKLKNATQRALDQEILPRFKSALKDDYPTLVDDVKVEVVKFADFNALADYEKHKIIIPLGLIVGQDLILNAVQTTMQYPQKASRFEPYINYLADRYQQAAEKGRDDLPVQDFAAFAHIPRSEYEKIYLSEEFQAIREKALVDSLALIVAHEFGHHAKHHKPTAKVTPAISRSQEEEADLFALNLCTKAKFPVLPGISSTFTLFCAFDSGGGKATHPPTPCRILAIGEAATREMKKDPGAMEGLAKVGMKWEDMERGFVELRKLCDAAKTQSEQ